MEGRDADRDRCDAAEMPEERMDACFALEEAGFALSGLRGWVGLGVVRSGLESGRVAYGRRVLMACRETHWESCGGWFKVVG